MDCVCGHPEGVDDGAIQSILGIKNHASVNQRCRELVAEQLIERRQVSGRIHNFPLVTERTQEAARVDGPRPWSWEGNVQDAVIRFLQAEGYEIIRAADTASKEHGKDVEARKGTNTLWVAVKGYPLRTPKTNPSLQAAHWFSDALFDVVSWRGEDPQAELALALPDYPRYQMLASRVAWLQTPARFHLLWVRENGSVYCTSPCMPG